MRRFPLSAARFAGAVHPILAYETYTKRFALCCDLIQTTLPFFTCFQHIITTRTPAVNRFSRVIAAFLPYLPEKLLFVRNQPLQLIQIGRNIFRTRQPLDPVLPVKHTFCHGTGSM